MNRQIGFSDVDGMAFDPSSGLLYGVTYSSNSGCVAR